MVLSSTAFATSITFTFANGQVTGTSPKYYEFDVMVQAGATGTKLGDAQAYINYNTSAFGTSVVSNGKITVTKGTILQGEDLGTPLYSIQNITDNTSSRFGVTTSFDNIAARGNDLPTTPTQYLHIKIEISDQSQTAGLSFEQSLMDGQEYESDNSTKYSPVVASDTDDSSLPVELSAFHANWRDGQVFLSWTTQSEIENLGFNVYRSENPDGPFEKINAELIRGAGTSTNAHHYSFVDTRIDANQTYYYKLEDIDVRGQSRFHGPVQVYVEKVELPDSYRLDQNYPNPFNPETTISYALPEDTHVKLVIYNMRGELVRELVNAQQAAGVYQLRWDGTSDSGQRLPSGIYFYKIETGSFSAINKMIFAK